MAVKKKKKEPVTPVKKKSQKSARKPKKASHPSISLELKKGIAALVVLVFVIASAAMVADFYLGDPDTATQVTTPSKTMVPTQNGWGLKPSPEAVPATSVQETDLHTKKPLQGLKHKYPGGNPEEISDGVPPPEVITAKPVPEESSTGKAGKGNKPIYEVFEKDQGIFPGRGDLPVPEGKEGLPLVAVIIDDVGFDKAMAMAFAKIDTHITMAILPGSPFGRVIANRLYVRDIEIMLHLPMEPMQYPEVDPGPGALMAGMSPDLLIATLRRNLDSIPHIKGVNNHMGSRLTTLSDQMRQVFTVLKKRDLFFIDSVTAAHSMCGPSARLLQLSFAQRDVFLDNVQNQAYITGQLNELIRISQRHGTAIGIGHPYPATLRTLKAVWPELKKKVHIVRASDLVVR